MVGKDYYAILGVSRNATEKEIKQVYRKLARQHHPDVNPGNKNAEARFKEINEAYEVLSDPEKRKKYDQFGDQWQYAEQFAKARPQGQPFREFRQGEPLHFEEGDLESLFGDLFGPRTGGRRTPRPRRGEDLEHPVELTLEEAYQGTSRTIALEVPETCSSCQGTGRIRNALCSVCRGSGVVSRSQRLAVKIPPGVDNGSRVRVAGKGGPGHQGGPSGDLYLVVSVRPYSEMERQGDDLYTEISVPLTVAVLGGEVQVPSVKGRLALKIPPETQNGQSFRLGGKGMPHLGDARSGDLLVRVTVALPQKLSEEERKLFEALRRLRPSG
ncbi:MAG: J domain-containing protein [Chloroflexota bacterium]